MRPVTHPHNLALPRPDPARNNQTLCRQPLRATLLGYPHIKSHRINPLKPTPSRRGPLPRLTPRFARRKSRQQVQMRPAHADRQHIQLMDRHQRLTDQRQRRNPRRCTKNHRRPLEQTLRTLPKLRVPALRRWRPVIPLDMLTMTSRPKPTRIARQPGPIRAAHAMTPPRPQYPSIVPRHHIAPIPTKHPVHPKDSNTSRSPRRPGVGKPSQTHQPEIYAHRESAHTLRGWVATPSFNFPHESGGCHSLSKSFTWPGKSCTILLQR